MGVTRPPPSRNPRRRRVAQAKALAAAAEPSQLARPASAQSRRAVESGRQQAWAWVDACPAYWRFRGLEPAAESAAACPTDTALRQARSHATTARWRATSRRGVLEARSYARVTSYTSNYIMQHLVGTFDPEIVWHAHTANSEQARGSGPRGRAGCARQHYGGGASHSKSASPIVHSRSPSTSSSHSALSGVGEAGGRCAVSCAEGAGAGAVALLAPWSAPWLAPWRAPPRRGEHGGRGSSVARCEGEGGWG